VKRIAVTYSLSLLVFAVLLTLIGTCHWTVDSLLAVK
jgi:hypothetical protein